ncbi:MAG: acyclic terpene utilization AtuA family protein [Pseudomonadota bacterium]
MAATAQQIQHKTLRIGSGAGFSSDRLEPAVDLARDGALDVLVFETIGERTLAFGHRDRVADPTRGYNPYLAARMRAILPHAIANGTRIITNMGVANVAAAADVVLAVAHEAGLKGVSVALVEGDDVTGLMTPDTLLVDHHNQPISDVGQPMLCANAYIGADAILPALETDAQVIITGRVADPSLFIAPIAHAFDWPLDDWERLGQGTLVGHLMECGMQVTGGYFADPGYKDVPDLSNCGYPIAEVAADGAVTLSKLDGTGGVISARTVKEQLLYEVHDPSAYLTPDVTADFSGAAITDHGDNRVTVTGGRGRPRPDRLKATVAFDAGVLAEAEVSYAGHGALRRAELAQSILKERLTRLVGNAGALRFDLIGENALHQSAHTDSAAEPDIAGAAAEGSVRDIRVRVALRTADRDAANLVLWETEALLCCGPAGGGGYRGRVAPSVITHSAMVPRASVPTRVTVRSN